MTHLDTHLVHGHQQDLLAAARSRRLERSSPRLRTRRPRRPAPVA